MALSYIYTGFENASPLDWEVDSDGTIQISLLYDHERNSPNRAAGHWHFQLHAKANSELTVVLKNFDNIWNGKPGSPISDRSNCYVSIDGEHWSALPAKKIDGNRLEIRVHMNENKLYLARLEPYRLSDLERLIAEIRDHPLVEITPIGRTVEGRELELIRVGEPKAPYRVLLRARSHPWEPGGNWVVQGLIKSLLRDAHDTQNYCVYIMPMASKDGVVRGHTRFNLMGTDLNRNWDRPAHPHHASENLALETALNTMIDNGMCPHLAIDLHNDNSGKLHISRPAVNLESYLANMKRFEHLMRRHTWFTEGNTGSSFRNSGTFGEGLLERYGVDACILELDCDWIAGLNKIPFGKDWEQLGEQMRKVFFAYFDGRAD